MPCRYDPSPQEIAAGAARQAATGQQKDDNISELERVNNVLSVRVDYLQDLVWRVKHELETEGVLSWSTEDDVAEVLDAQKSHRQSDLDRLVRVLAVKTPIDYDRLNKVLAADPTQPLEPQLGFDPDSF